MPDYINAAFEAIVTDPIVEGENRIVSLYLVHQFYGGPEEGGWYYDWNTLVRHTPCVTTAQAERIKKEMQEEKFQRWIGGEDYEDYDDDLVNVPV